MKLTKRILALATAALMLLSLVACTTGGNGEITTTAPNDSKDPTPAGTTAAADPTTKAPEASKSPETTKEPAKTEPATTAAPETEAPLAVDSISKSEMDILRLAMPISLPDGSDFEILTRLMCMDNDADYTVGGNSKGSTKFVGESEGAIYGKAICFAGKADSKDSRGEIEVSPAEVKCVEGARGILFYVDFSHLTPEEGKEMCASVTINTNSVRSKGTGENGSAVAWYFLDGIWTQTTNINACRLQIPQGFAGWIYVPATSFTQTSDGLYWNSATNTFTDTVYVDNMRCYTDGYKYSADSYVIFDEITFIK